MSSSHTTVTRAKAASDPPFTDTTDTTRNAGSDTCNAGSDTHTGAVTRSNKRLGEREQ